MAEITKEQFKVVGKNTKTMESISRPNIGYWQDAWRRIRKNKIAFFSLCLIGLYVLMAIFVPMFSKYDIATQSVAEMNQSFSKAHWFGTDSLGRDLWVRAWSGARVSLTIGFAASISIKTQESPTVPAITRSGQVIRIPAISSIQTMALRTAPYPSPRYLYLSLIHI